MSSSQKLPILLYRSLLRWARDHKDIPFSIKTSDLYSLNVLPRGSSNLINSLQDSTAVSQITKQIFRQNRQLNPTDASTAIDIGIKSLHLLNTTYASLLEDMKRTRADRQHRDNVRYQIGDVFIHKKHGYRGVIYGWDRRCLRDNDWIQQFNANPDEAHYYVLPDEGDCLRLFKGPRLTKYVGESNILKLEGVRILHRALDFHFIGYSTAKNRYIPVKRIQYEYPDDDAYTMDDEKLVPAGEDSNLLKHHPEKGYNDKNNGVEGSGGDGGSLVSSQVKEKAATPS